MPFHEYTASTMDTPFLQELNGTWILQGRFQRGPAVPADDFGKDAEFRIPAEVPGNIEDALAQAGIIPDPYFGCNSRALRKFEFYEWILEREFDFSRHGERSLELHFQGIDLLGTVFLNGECIGTCRNAFIPHQFAASLRHGRNRLAVHLASVGRALESIPFNAGDFAGGICFNYENLRFRRPAHETGWDIAPRMALGGIFRSVAIQEKPQHYFQEAFLQTLAIRDHGRNALLRLSFHAVTPMLGDPDVMLTVDGQCGESLFHGERVLWSSQGCLTFSVEVPKLWQIRHYGEPNLYDVTVRLIRKTEILAEKKFPFGIRTIRLERKPTATESASPDFQFYVNDQKVRLWGLNHVPADALHSHDTLRLPELLEKFRFCNVNAIRVWGGGIYEPDFFYDYCDRNGIFVWQDFMMACAKYPNDADFLGKISEEAECVIRMLRQHPSIGLWCGDNECDMVPSWSGFPDDPNQNKITRELLPELCRRHDPMRPFLPSSPYYSPAAIAAAKGTDPLPFAPEQHLWGDRSYFKNDFYRCSNASFVSETGYHGAAAADSIRKFLPADSCYPLENPAGYMHATNANYPHDLTNNYRIGVMQKQIDYFFKNVPQNLDDFALASQIVQAEADKFLIENYRFKAKCSGLILWNLADCWPECSDAICDYYGTGKLAYFYLPMLFRDTLLILNDIGELRGLNDSPREHKGCCQLFRNGKLLQEISFVLPPESVDVPLGILSQADCTPGVIRLQWQLENGECGKNHALFGAPLFDYPFFKKQYLPDIAQNCGFSIPPSLP